MSYDPCLEVEIALGDAKILSEVVGGDHEERSYKRTDVGGEELHVTYIRLFKRGLYNMQFELDTRTGQILNSGVQHSEYPHTVEVANVEELDMFMSEVRESYMDGNFFTLRRFMDTMLRKDGLTKTYD